MKQIVDERIGITIGCIITIIVIWVAFFSRFYDGLEYIFAWLLTVLFVWILIFVLVAQGDS